MKLSSLTQSKAANYSIQYAICTDCAYFVSDAFHVQITNEPCDTRIYSISELSETIFHSVKP